MSYRIEINNPEKEKNIPTVETKGYLLAYLDGDQIKIQGNIEAEVLGPILMKVAMKQFGGTL